MGVSDNWHLAPGVARQSFPNIEAFSFPDILILQSEACVDGMWITE